jgi:hypothetical protein
MGPRRVSEDPASQSMRGGQGGWIRWKGSKEKIKVASISPMRVRARIRKNEIDL